MALKKRGRPPKAGTVKARDQKASKRHWVDCDCGGWGAEVDGDITKVVCPYCCQKMVAPPPIPKPKLTPEEKAARKEERERRKAEKALVKKDLGFGRGWHRKYVFTAEVEGEQKYFSLGKEITKKEYDKIAKSRAAVSAKKPTAGWGRGWHLKDKFVSPEGDVYESGSLVQKATKEPTEEELEQLFTQHGA